MNLDALLETCESKGIKFNLSGEKLTVKAPPGAMNKALAANLKQFKPQLIEFLRRNDTQAQSARRQIEVRRQSGPMPLSFGQRRLWLLHQMDASSGQYNIPFVVSLSGALNRSALQQAFANIIERHEVLRSCYQEIDSEPCQVVLQDYDFDVEWVEASLSADDNEITQLVTERLVQPFDLTREIMLRVSVIQLAEKQHILIAVMHHIASDAWSMDLLLDEFLHYYQDPVSDDTNLQPLPGLPIQYSDFAQWQQDFSATEQLSGQLDYWQEQLRNIPALHSLPTDFKRPAQFSFKGAEQKVNIDAQLTTRIRKLCQAHDLTLFMLLDAALTVLLAKYSGTTDIIIGTPVSGRNQAQTERLIGFFVNTLVLRLDIEDCATLLDVALKAKSTLLDGLENQDAPFDLVVERIAPQRSSSYNPIFQTMLVVQNKSLASQGGAQDKGESFSVSEMALSSQTSKFDITVTVTESEQDLNVSWEYATDLFAAQTIAGIAESFVVLLQQMVTDVRLPIKALNLSPPAQYGSLIEMGRGLVREPAKHTVTELFAISAQQQPQRMAVSDCQVSQFDQRTLSFQQVVQVSDNLATELIVQGVKSGDRVGVCLTRNRYLPAALLGVFKAGAAYVPLDPNYPQERLLYMAEDSGMSLVVADEQTQDRLTGLTVPMVSLAKAFADNLGDEHHLPGSHIASSLEDVAYLIYTSGSTGKPKGVVITHANLSALLYWAKEHFSEDERRCILASTSLSFDLSVFELFLPLAFGTEVRVVNNLLSLLENPEQGEGVSLINTVPSAISTLAQASAIPDSVQVVNVAGEVLTRATVNSVYQSSRVTKVYNLYGPSEDTTYSTWELVRNNQGQEPLIGRPITNTQALVLDAQLRPVPVNMPGELYLSGAGVTFGYYQRAEITEQNFLDNPYASEKGESRLYKTGDLVRWNNEGKLVFLGRRDHQVKIRGFRIEIGEIESALLSCSGVDKAAVVVSGKNQDLLVACIVLNVEASAEAFVTKVQQNLQSQLPPHMVPAVIHIFDQLPHTPSGKIDRQSIQLPEISEQQREVVAPQNDAEVLLLKLWQEVLGLEGLDRESLSVTEDFFQMGGHSLHAARILARLRAQTGCQIGVADFFQHPTIRGLALILGEQQIIGIDEAISKAPTGEPIPLSYAQKRLWFIDYLLPEAQKATYNIPLLLQLDGQLKIDAVQQALTKLVERHEMLRTAILQRSEEGWPIQQVMDNVVPALELIELTPDKRDMRIHQFVNQAFNLAEPLKLRAALFRLAENQHILALSMHHIASDGWSLKVLLKDFHHFYTQAEKGQSVNALPELPIQFSDYAYWQGEQQEQLEQNLAFWQAQLQGIPAAHSLPLDFKRGQTVSYRGRSHRSLLPVELGKQVLQFAREQGVTPFILLQSVFALLLSKWSREPDIVMGTAVANRASQDIEPLVGFFVNTLVLRTQVQEQQSFADMLVEAKHNIAAAFGHGQMPFDYLLDTLNLPRSEAIHPIFQIMFTMQNNDMEVLDLNDLQVSECQIETQFAKFDLSLNVVEADGQFICDWEYCSDLFAEHTIEAMSESFAVLIESVLVEPQQPIATAQIVSATQHCQLEVLQQLTKGFSEPLLPIAFEETCVRQAEQKAVSCDGESLTFGQLQRRVQYLADELKLRGIGSGNIIGICLPRSIDMVVAILAVHKAGAAYLPLDPTYPEGRLQYMLEDAKPSMLLSHETLIERLSFDGDKLALDNCDYHRIKSVAPWQVDIAPDDLAYVIYTSGSTGRPKGVMVGHDSLMNLTYNLQDKVIKQLCASESAPELTRWALNASMSFDASLQGLGLLCLGVELHILTEQVRQDPIELLNYFAQHNITLFDCTPSQLETILKAQEALGNSLQAPSLQLPSMLIGGENLGDDLWQQLTHKFEGSGRYCWNVYGPTESTVDATIALVQNNHIGSTIGQPFAGVQVRIVDEQLHDVPPGVFGELLLAGQGLALGYLERPELTAEKFIALSNKSGEKCRYYRTGDLVRWRKNRGQEDYFLAYMARIDNQIKLRGYRIELSEIESVLKQQSEIDDAVVILNESHQAIVAYVVSANTYESSASEFADIKQRLAEYLPVFMLPAAILPIDAVPLSPSGKVNTKALPAYAPQIEQVDIRLPITVTEQRLADIWRQLLKREEISAQTQFYDLGGYSLLLVELATLIRTEFDCGIPLERLMRNATIEQMATLIDSGEFGAERAEVESNAYQVLCKGLRKGQASLPALFLLPALDGFGTSYLQLATSLSGEYPIYAMQFDNYQVDSMPQLAKCYLEQIQEIQPSGPYLLAGWSFGGSLAHEIACLLWEQGETVGLLIKLDSGWPILGNFNISPEQIVEELAEEYASFDMSDLRIAEGVDAKLKVLLEQGKQSGAMPPSMDLIQLQSRFNIIRHHYQLLVDYQPGFYPGESHFINGRDSVVDAAHIAHWQTRCEVQQVQSVPGNHHSMMAEPAVEQTADGIDTLINKKVIQKKVNKENAK